MQIKHLRTFTAVASALNVTRAAERLHLAQSSVTEQIQALEADLGAILFDRSKRRLRLTDAGRRLLDHATDLLSLADEARSAVAELADQPSGSLTVGGLETLCSSLLPPVLTTFCTAHPAVAVRMAAAGSGELRSGVRAGDIDVAFVFGDGPPEDGVERATVARERLSIIAPPGHRLAGRNAVARDDLADEPFLVTVTGCVYRRMFDEAFPVAGVGRPRLAGEFGSIGAIRALVAAGLGCALVPECAAAAATGLTVLPWVGEADHVPVSMLWRRRRVQPPGLRLFLATVRGGIGAIRPDGGHRRCAERTR
ncbi:LysR family transcriptional regulator [Azospirillum sp. RWY-5-1]|uniref:LysR family transcriptional regulator n=1 Tax=Azospirillum oleiclasticum TaxID=2735135 RepID=A0ABX2TKV5_9PROT|nr:LysR family transcriptional regulator [Azospirillum oleiclasticum]NYZ16232.1 LysR family transcriptional regulator [Azospirillum oleiclasticum]NYZ23719.1 LysR family transcriptional regulator [Azospirillum oleiclasticum]